VDVAGVLRGGVVPEPSGLFTMLGMLGFLLHRRR
jgi:hypothetical protein